MCVCEGGDQREVGADVRRRKNRGGMSVHDSMEDGKSVISGQTRDRDGEWGPQLAALRSRHSRSQTSMSIMY